MASRDNVLGMLIQNTLSRAYPQGLPSNTVLQQFSSENDAIAMPDYVNAIIRNLGYPYGWGEFLPVWSSWSLTNLTSNQYPGSLAVLSGHTSGTATISVTEPKASAWIIRMSGYQPSGTSVALSANSQSLTALNAAQVLNYGDPFTWKPAFYNQSAATAKWGSIPNWPDANAQWMGPDATYFSDNALGEWLLKKWLYVPDSLYYTVYVSADDTAKVYIDGQYVVTGSYKTTSSSTIYLSQGFHLVTVDVINYGLQPPATGVLISIQDPQGNVIEDGLGQDWFTSGFINPVWSYTGAVPLMMYSWYAVNAPASTNLSLTLTLNGMGAIVNNLWLYSVAPWKWDEGALYDQTTQGPLPVSVTTVESVST